MAALYVFKDIHGFYRMYTREKFRFSPAGTHEASSFNPHTMKMGRSRIVADPPRFYVDHEQLPVVRNKVERVRPLVEKYEAAILSCDERIAELSAALVVARASRQEVLAEAYRNSYPVKADELIGKDEDYQKGEVKT